MADPNPSATRNPWLQDGPHPLVRVLGIVQGGVEALYQGARPSVFLSGFTDLDRLLGGFQPGDLLTLAGRAEVGKTAFALAVAARTALDHRRPVLYLSLQDSLDTVVERLVAARAGVELERLTKGPIYQEELARIEALLHALQASPLTLEATPALSLADLEERVAEARDVGLVVVDDFHLLGGGQVLGWERAEWSAIGRALKTLARRRRVPLLVVPTLPRGSRPWSQCPTLGELRHLGTLEEDGDVVMFLHRDGAHGRDGPTIGTARIVVAKHRTGPQGAVDLFFNRATGEMADLRTADDAEGAVGGAMGSLADIVF